MLTEERHQIILDLIQQKGIVTIKELITLMNSSESTIRRDLSQLELLGKLKRIHGGATLISDRKEELSVVEKSSKNLEEKQLIGAYAASLVQDGDCIYIDAGTTTLQMIHYIHAKNVTVVTNGTTHIEPLLQKGLTTYIVSGYVKEITRAIIGPNALESLNKFHFDKTFIGVNGIHINYGYTTPDPEEAAIKGLAMSLAEKSYILADSSKFNETVFAKIGNLNNATIITSLLDEDILNEYKKKTNIEVVK